MMCKFLEWLKGTCIARVSLPSCSRIGWATIHPLCPSWLALLLHAGAFRPIQRLHILSW